MKDCIVVSIFVGLILFGFISLMSELATVQPNVHKILSNK